MSEVEISIQETEMHVSYLRQWGCYEAADYLEAFDYKLRGWAERPTSGLALSPDYAKGQASGFRMAKEQVLHILNAEKVMRDNK